MSMRSGISFDHTAAEFDGPAYWSAMHELRAHGPVTWVESNGGFWAATSFDMVLRMAQDWETCSSAQGVALQRPGPDELPYIMPIDIDPPRQRAYRKQVNPHLVPKVVADLEEPIRAMF